MRYKIIGGDGQEYGPVAETTILEWIADGRLDASSKIRPENAGDWSALGDLPEFAAALAGPHASAAPAPLGRIDVGECISSAFTLFGRHWTKLVVASIIWIVATLAIMILTSLLNLPAALVVPPTQSGQAPDPAAIFAAMPLYIPGMLVSVIANSLLWAGALRFLVRVVRGGDPDFADLFSGFQRRQIPIILTGLAQAALTFLGAILLILPGIYLSVAYVFAAPLALEGNQGVWQTLEAGRRAITRQWWQMFALVLIAFVFTIAGACLCLVGLLAAYPICGLMFARAYNDLFGRRADG